MITSKLSSKAQTTLPRSVRAALGVSEGDVVAYRIDQEAVVMTKARVGAAEDPFAAFAEWNSEADERGYDGF